MNILIAGGTGFIGSALSAYLLKDNHDITVITRHPDSISRKLTGIKSASLLTEDQSFDAVVNLTGEPIADKRWSDNQKQKITESRLASTEQLIAFFKRTQTKPSVFISASAIGYYGLGMSDEAIDETYSGDTSFSSSLCARWEALALQAEALGIRTCLLRTGIVLGEDGGALKKMLTPFKLGLGGKIGSGNQWMSWIHLHDLVGIIQFCLNNDRIKGPINGTAPNPVTNASFTLALGGALNRPTLFSMPSFVVKLLMGEMGEELLLSGRKIIPAKVQKAGYQFEFENIESALKDIF